MSRLRSPSIPALVGRFGTYAEKSAERTAWAPRRPMLRPLLGPHSSSSECLEQCCMLGRADCGFRRIAALTGLGS
eukprot:1346782-Alexandrium_andersonii.AAC.1